MSNTTVPNAPQANSDSMGWVGLAQPAQGISAVLLRERRVWRWAPLTRGPCWAQLPPQCCVSVTGWTGFAITCSLCTAMTPPRSCTRPSRSCSLTWETPRWYMAGRVATSTSGCPCWMSRRDPSPLPSSSEPWGPGPCSLLLPPNSQLTFLGLHAPHPPVPGSTCSLSPT
ncbi:small integral membrane protein 29 isoform X1 [Phacochoerus africanus]|uniref:small integral membrane protein 29 isoform X1 n=1 Tax=Phacochoerus africanus TaxID=41426 RepID=UPI001FD88C80|nr:small integral membrane protein 29 isoform X1 [Phacochoerus africanus]